MSKENQYKMLERLSRYTINVARRDDKKKKVRSRRAARFGGSAETDGIALQSQMLMTEQEVSTRGRSLPGAAVTSAAKRMLNAATDNLTLSGKKAVRTIDINTRHGREYTPGGQAEQMMRQCAVSHLAAAMSREASEDLATKRLKKQQRFS